MTQVAAVRTPLTFDDVSTALAIAGCPNVNAIRMLAAQSGVETANWTNCYNFALGNIVASNLSTQEYTARGLNFLAFDNLQDGADSFVQFITKIGGMQYAAAGDAIGYTSCLRRNNYYGDSSDEAYSNYLGGIQARLRQWGGTQITIPSVRFATLPIAVGVGIGVLAFVAYAADRGWLGEIRRRLPV